MRKNRLYYITLNIVMLSLVFCGTGCSSADQSVQWFVEIDSQCQEDFCQEVLASTLSILHGQIYILTKRGEIVTLERDLEIKDERDINFPSHQFFIFDKNIRPKIGNGKVYMRFHLQNKDGLYNADFLIFLFQKNGSWERVLNPGNFSFKKELTQIELQERIQELIVKLTFK